MELNTLERVMLMGVLPKEGTFANLKLLRIAKEDLSFSEEENKELNFRQEGEQLHWDDLAQTKEVNFGDTVTGLIVETLISLNDKGKLTENHFSLYEKFIT
jgi:hypothetical protein